MSEYSKMTLEDAKELLKRIKKEIYRRSGMDEEGNPLLDEQLRHFNLPILDAPDDSLFDIGYTDDVIRALNGSPIINTLINIGDFKDLRTVNEYDPIPQAFDIDEIKSILTQLESEPYDSAYTSCRSACTGLCINNCTSSCSGGCENSCSMCSSQCSGMCSTECTGCSVSCGTDCGVSCGTSCASDSSACAGCSSGCVSCTGCSETCTSSCTGCNTTCYTGCNGGLSSYATADSCTENNCSSGCGNKSSSTPAIKTTYGISLYNDEKIYGISKTDLKGNGTFTLPDFDVGSLDPYKLYSYDSSVKDHYWSDGYVLMNPPKDPSKYWYIEKYVYGKLVETVRVNLGSGTTFGSVDSGVTGDTFFAWSIDSTSTTRTFYPTRTYKNTDSNVKKYLDSENTLKIYAIYSYSEQTETTASISSANGVSQSVTVKLAGTVKFTGYYRYYKYGVSNGSGSLISESYGSFTTGTNNTYAKINGSELSLSLSKNATITRSVNVGDTISIMGYTKTDSNVSSSGNGTSTNWVYSISCTYPAYKTTTKYRVEYETDDTDTSEDNNSNEPQWIANASITGGVAKLVENVFYPEDTLYYANSDSDYENYVALGRKATRNDRLTSAVTPYWTSCTKYHLSSDISSTTDILSVGSPYTIDQNTNAIITAVKNGNKLEGYDPKVWSVKIDDVCIKLPYAGVLPQGSVIEVTGDASIIFKIKRTVLPKKSCTIDTTKGKHALDLRCWCTEYDVKYNLETETMSFTLGDRKACSLIDNEYAKCEITTLGGINAIPISTINMSVESHLILGADEKYHGYLYEIEVEYHAIPEAFVNSIKSLDFYRTYGMSSLKGDVTLVDTDEYTIITNVDLTEYRSDKQSSPDGSYYEYQFTIPEDIDSDIIGFQGINSNTDPDITVVYKPGQTYSLFCNQHIVLKAIRESDNNG